MLGEPHPAAADAVGERFTFEKSVSRTSGGKGFADIWLRDHFAWEYKGKHKNLAAAYKQLNDYREDLLNPPLLVVCDMNCFEIHTNFGKTKKRVYKFDLRDLELNKVTANCPLPPLEVLHALFHDTDRLRPERTDAFVTQEAAKIFARMAERLEIEKRSLTSTPIQTKEEIAHFLLRLLFCLFADNIGLLPDHLFRRLIDSEDRFTPRIFLRKLRDLFKAMSEPEGIFGEHTIKYFNGGLFDNASVVDLDKADLGLLHEVATRYDWSHVAPAIFGTLFERSLDPVRRSLIGAHYTSEADILLVVEPVVIHPVRTRWEQTKSSILALLGGAAACPVEAPTTAAGKVRGSAADQPHKRRGASVPGSLFSSNSEEAEAVLAGFFDYISSVRVLDPACGSGNFLYVALRKLLDLWLEARDFAIHHNFQLATQYAADHMVSPAQLFGIEVEYYAYELASVVVWIGFLQWKFEHGIFIDRQPILQTLTNNIEHSDAILQQDAQTKQTREPLWPPADFIVSNPPFLGGKLLRRTLGDVYVDQLFELYKGRVKAESDLVVYWFEKARHQLEVGSVGRVGLLATQGIRGGANRAVLERIQQTGRIFWAWSDRKWLLAGAAVHVSMVAFEGPAEQFGNSGLDSAAEDCLLDGWSVPFINPDLTTGSNTASASRLKENANLCFMGTTKVGAFDIDAETAREMLSAPLNPNGHPNSDVVRPWVNALDFTRRPRNMFIIDFGTDMSEAAAAMYEMPFEYIKHHVKPTRISNKRETYAKRWWIHGEARAELRRAIRSLFRYIVTPSLSKHRFFVWTEQQVIPDHQVFAYPRQDDYFFGILHSRAHELWALKMGTQLESRPRYTPDSCFDTFPLPWPPSTEPSEDKDSRVKAIADAARELVRLRDAWLNPPNASEEELKDRTLTKLYNNRPAWLENAHQTLDRAVFTAYGWAYPLLKDEIIRRLLELNRERAAGHVRAPIPDLPPKKAPEAERSPKRRTANERSS
jgi:type II restriction/modification system DNA methylase subunit YeeA